MEGIAVAAAVSAKTAFWLASSVSHAALALFLVLPVPVQVGLAIGGASLFYEHPNNPVWYAKRRCRFSLERRLRAYVHQDIFERDDPNLGGTVDYVAAGRVWRPHWYPIWKKKNVWQGKVRPADELNEMLLAFPAADDATKLRYAKCIASLIQLAGERGDMHSFNIGAPPAVRQFLAPWFMFTVRETAGLPAANLDLSDLRVGKAVYVQVDGLISEESWKQRMPDFERVWGCKVVIETLKGREGKPMPGFIVVRPEPNLPDVIPLEAVMDGDPRKIWIGVDARTARPVYIWYHKFLHVCIQGITGKGKSWWIRMLLRQLLKAPGVNSITIICFKGAVDYMEFFGPEDPVTKEPATDYMHESGIRIRIIWDLREAEDRIRDAVIEMNAVRLPMMRACKIDYWPGGDDWIICDEYAFIKQQKNHEFVINLWTALAQRVRAAGGRLVCCTQQSTTDAIPSQLRSCLDSKICLAVETPQIAAGMFGTTVGLPSDPTKLPIGRYLTYHHDLQEYLYLQGLQA